MDQTPYLFHFTKGSFQEAKNNLYSILYNQKLISYDLGYVCFTASPITSLYSFFNVKVNATGLPFYHPFGIGFNRDILIEQFNARNVIYSSLEEIFHFPKEILWRCKPLDINRCDSEYLREWRILRNKFDLSNFPREQILIIAPIIVDIHFGD